MLLQLDVTEAPIVARHVYEGTDPETAEANTSPIGTGSFRFVSYSPDGEIVLEGYDDYFKQGLPRLNEIVCASSPTPGTRSSPWKPAR